MANRYATKKRGKTEVYPFWNFKDIKNMIDWFKGNDEWDGYLTFMLGLLLGRRIGDTISMKWSDLYYENGKRKNEIRTIEEQKTGKITIIPISSMVFDAIDEYSSHTKIKPEDHVHDYIFNIPSKTEWINRKNCDVYKKNDLESWCKFLNKDFTKARKDKILKDFKDQDKYETLGEYIYHVVEYMDIVKWQIDGFRKKFNKAANDVGIEYPVSCHSLRKTFGYISKMIHPDDPNALVTLQDIFNHADLQTTLHYIGLSEERKRKYFDDMGDVIRDVQAGNVDIQINNSPIISFKHDDFRGIIMHVIKNVNKKDDIDVLNDAMTLADKLKIKSI